LPQRRCRPTTDVRRSFRKSSKKAALERASTAAENKPNNTELNLEQKAYTEVVQVREVTTTRTMQSLP
jgi:hypothetical protein